jgi:phosphoglycerate dehydrogenase-like enzyme
VLRILSQVGRLEAIDIPVEIAGQIELIAIPSEGELEPGLTGDVLLTRPSLVPNLAHVLSRGPRWVHLIGTGIDDFPLELIGEDCVLTNSRGLSAMPISEWVMACMLSFEKRMPGSFIAEPPKMWNVPRPGFGTLYGGTLALLGLGGIGTAVAQRALPFGMNIKALRNTDAPSPVPGVEIVRTIDELVADADHIVMVAPLTEATRGLFDDRVFSLMKPGVHLVNVARGPMIDEDALRRALDAEIVACASIDSTDPEPLPAGHWMYSHPSVRVSPHSSWHWPGAFPAMFEMFIENLRRHLAGEPLLSVVDPANGY